MPSHDSASIHIATAASEGLAADVYFERATGAMQGRDWRAACENLCQVLLQDSTSLAAAARLESCLDEMNLVDGGAAVLRDLLRQEGAAESPLLLNVLAGRLNESGCFAQAALLEKNLLTTFGGRLSHAYAFSALGLFDAAERSLLTLENHPAILPQYQAEVCRLRGVMSSLNSHYSEAVPHYRQALQLGCDDRNLHFSLAFALLASGDISEGWNHFAWRWRPERPAWKDVPFWSGEAVHGKVVLVNSEQGAGDVIFSLRWLPLLQATGARVVFQTSPEILAMLGRGADATELPPQPSEELRPDLQLDIMDLPRVLGEHDPLESNAPYLCPRPELVKKWRRRLDELAPGIRIGLVWAGNSLQKNDVNRSMSLMDLELLQILPGITWVSLQKGRAEAEQDQVPPGMHCVALGAELHDFADTAAAICNLDLVITVCTSVAHMAGSLGMPFWMLATCRHLDFRWMEDGNSTPWYPSARIMRQPFAGGWRTLVSEQLLPELMEWLAEPQRWQRLDPTEQCWLERCRGRGGDAAFVAQLNQESDPRWLARGARLAALEDQPALLEQLTALLGKNAPELTVCLWADWCVEHKEYEDAIGLLTQLREQQKGLPPRAYALLSDSLSRQQKFAEAAEVLQEALAQWPARAELHARLGSVASRLDDKASGLAAFVRACELDPRNINAHIGAGFQHKKHGNASAAAQYLQRAVLLDPAQPLAWFNLAGLAIDAGAWHFARACIEQQLLLQPTAAAHTRLGTVLKQLWLKGDQQAAAAAVSAFERAMELEPDAPLHAFNLGQSLKNLGRREESIAFLQKAATLKPDNPDYQMALGWQLLADGRSLEGWQAYSLGMRTRPTRIPEWDGSPLAGRTLLVYQDQGYGDLFQFFDLVRDIDGDVTLAVYHAALSLLQEQNLPYPIRRMDDIDWQGDGWDLQIAIMKLPHLLGGELLQTRRRWPYLSANDVRRQKWRESLQADSNLRVGIVWSGSSRFSGNATRSTHFADWQGLKAIKGVSFYSLQKDEYSNQVLYFPDFPIINIAVQLHEFSDTAAAIMELDLVICTCTAVAHLAGGLGKRVWVLLPSVDPDFRWLRDRNDSPWYPCARLLRKQSGQSWPEVLAQVELALRQEVIHRG